MEDRHRLAHHVVVGREPLALVAGQRVGEGVDQAAIAERAGPLGLVPAGGEDLRQIVVRDQRPGDGDAVEVPFLESAADQGAALDTRRC